MSNCNCDCDCNRDDINELKNKLSEIKISDTISTFMEKCNNNFEAIVEWGGGPGGQGGEQGVPTKPKVPIHVWKKGVEYKQETQKDYWNSESNMFEIEDNDINVDLTDSKYQEGHLIMLENGHVYILNVDTNNFELKPTFIITLQTFNNGQDAFVHFAYANSPDGNDGFITDQQIRGEEPVSTFNMQRTITFDSSSVTNDRTYMGVYSDNEPISSDRPERYTWVRIQGGAGVKGDKGDKGDDGVKGDKGEKGDKGDSFTGQPYTIDLEGDMATISIDIDRTRLYDESGDYCECKLHAYYGDENVKVSVNEVTVEIPKDYNSNYKYSNNFIVSISDPNDKIGEIVKIQEGNDVVIKFIPDEKFVFPNKTIIFPIHVETSIFDENDKNTYKFTRDTVWMVKGIMSKFELEIFPQYRIIKCFEDGKYFPETLFVYVYKIEDTKRSIFNFEENTDFTFLYKDYNDTDWKKYPNDGVNTTDSSCLEFKVVKNYGSTDPENPEEIWDYEDVWVVSDGKGVHYYHADLGNTESMMVLTTGEKIEIETTEHGIIECAELRDESGYSITFEPKFFDGSEELEVVDINIGPNSGEYYYNEGSFERTISELKTETINGVKKYTSTFTVTRVPYNVDMIPMTFNVIGMCPETGEEKIDMVSFNIYISSLSNIYTLIPTVSSYNTSTGKTGDKIGCNVYKNNIHIPLSELDENALTLKYIVHNGKQENLSPIIYDEEIIYGDDDDYKEDEFTASDVAIEFLLEYRGMEIVRSTVPLVKDGVDGRDGDTWQYIFCRSPKYPFEITGISNPNNWENDPEPNNPDHEYLGDNENQNVNPDPSQWYDDHKGIDSIFRYEYQSYRKWDKDNKKWGAYGKPTLYSNYSESGSGYSVLLSNPVAVIPVGEDWSTDENNKNQSDSTLVYLYNNTSDISNNNHVEISLPEMVNINSQEYHPYNHFSLTKENDINKIIFNPIINFNGEDKCFEFEPNAQFKLPINIIYNLSQDNDNDSTIDNFSSTINWTLTPIRGLNDVEVFVDKRVVNNSMGSEHTLKVGYYLISSNNTTQFVEEYNDHNKYEIILTDDIRELSPDDTNVLKPTNWGNVEYNFINQEGENRNCYVVLVEPVNNDDETTYNIIDYTNITSVINGKDGNSAIHLELTQDYIALPSNTEGGVHDDYIEPITSQMLLYNGDELITSTSIKYSFKKDNKDVNDNDITVENDGTFTIPKSLISGDTNIECIAEFNNTLYRKILVIDLEETPYELDINLNILNRDMNIGKIIDEELIVNVKCWLNGKWENIDYGVVKVTTNNANTIDIVEISENNIDRILNIQNSNLVKNTIDSNVRISYYKDDSDDAQELSYETIGIVNGGLDGELWQYIYCNSPIFPFNYQDEISDPSKWKKDKNKNDPSYVYLGEYESGYNKDDIKWFDHPIGVDSTNKYQYQSYRKWNKVEKSWSNYNYPTLYSNYSESGSGYSALLSNPVAVIPVGEDWSTDENNKNQSDSTLVYLYDNTSDKSNKIDIYIPENPHFSKDKDKNGINRINFNPVVYGDNGEEIYFTFEENTQYKLPITITYTLDSDIDGDSEPDSFSTTIDWTLTPIRGLNDVEVFVDKRVVNITSNSEYNIVVGYYLISSNKDKQFIGKYDDERNIYNYEIILTDDINNLTIDDTNVLKPNNWGNVTYNFIKDENPRNCYVVLVKPVNNDDETTYNIIDYSCIIPVSDGINGIDGNPAMHLELTQDYIALPSNETGDGVNDAYNTETHPIKSQMLLYNGYELVTDNNIQYSFEINDEPTNDIISSENGVFYIDEDLIKGDTIIKCIAKYNDSYFYKTLFIDLEKIPYELEINKNLLTRDVNKGEIVDEELTVSVKCWLDGVWHYTNNGVVILKTNTNPNTYVFSKSDIDGYYLRRFNITNENIKNNTYDTGIRISYYSDDDISFTKELSYENIGIVNYYNPTFTKTTRIGFSLEEPNEDEIYDDDFWVKSLNELDQDELKIGVPIYILYEETWNYDTNTTISRRYVTVTISGSQGVEGKSRVLFYLGSFEGNEPTLKENSVTGLLTDERCDYYIDKNGQAWMRIGDSEFATGYSTGNENGEDDNKYWKKSDKVGFLQAGAITADMINTGSIIADEEFVTKLFAQDITADKLKVTSANIDGDLEGKTIKSSIKIDGEIPTWQINGEGDGWLANKNIFWDTDGNLTINGKLTTTKDSKIGSWYTWENGTISTLKESEVSVTNIPMIQFTHDGSGHLCNKNISWDTEGNLTVKSVNNGSITIETGGWEIGPDGIKSINNTATFNNDGSGQIGGYYIEDTDDDIYLKKGMEWDKNGNVTFYNHLVSKPEYVKLSDNMNDESVVIRKNAPYYIFIDEENSNPNSDDDMNCTCYRAYLSWFNFFDKFDIENGTTFNFTLINHSYKTVEFYINEAKLKLPYRKKQDSILNMHNYYLMTNDTYGGYKNILQILYLLPGSKLELCVSKYNNECFFYIYNISDFRISNAHTISLTKSKPSIKDDISIYNDEIEINEEVPICISLISTNYDINTYNNIGGYSHINTNTTDISHSASSCIRLLFGNYIYTGQMEGNFKITTTSYKYNSNSDFCYVSTYTNPITYEFNKIYNHDITCSYAALYLRSYNEHLKISISLNENHTGKRVKLILYSPLYNTSYHSKNYTITSSNYNNINIEFPDGILKHLAYLSENQQTGILDLYATFYFNDFNVGE